MSELTLYVAGMGCRRCVREVTARLRDVAGVETVVADAGRSHVRLSGSMTLPDVVRALAGTTYRAEVVPGATPDPTPAVTPDGTQDGTPGGAENRARTEPGQRRP